jgi:hypothetical protein
MVVSRFRTCHGTIGPDTHSLVAISVMRLRSVEQHAIHGKAYLIGGGHRFAGASASMIRDAPSPKRKDLLTRSASKAFA